MTTDVKLKKTDAGYYDISWTDSGDIETIQSFDTYILMCLFEEVRASASEVIEANRRRGWLGNEHTSGFQQGSKSWLFEQERITGSMLSELGVIIRNALQSMIDEKIAVNVEVEQPFLKDGQVCCYINITRDGSKVDRRFYQIWQNTGNI